VTCKVVCISHAAGAGGEEVGRLVAERLGFLYVDEDIVARAAAKGGIDPGEVADAERRKSLAARVLEIMAQGGGETWALAGRIPRGAEELTSDEIQALIREAIEQTAARGNVVIVAHGASQAVAEGPGVLRALVTASPTTRATRLSGGEGIDLKRATRIVRDEDAGRRSYLKRFYDVDEELPTHYDLVVNTDVLSLERSADLLIRAASD
jgi:cytidylate kinase